MARPEWRSTQVLAWTDREGPGRPPSGPAVGLWTATAATLAIVFSVIMFTDALCPEHRMWVQTLAGLALVGVVTSIVGLVRGWASAPLLTVGSAAVGGGIGLIDTVHSPVRGGFIAAAFAVALVLSAWMAVRQVPLLRWDRRLRRDTAPAESTWPAEPAADVTASGTAEAAPPEVHVRQ
ncbi:MAG: hypothetical protein ACR2MO_08830 [Acidimicrobiales bacterium]